MTLKRDIDNLISRVKDKEVLIFSYGNDVHALDLKRVGKNTVLNKTINNLLINNKIIEENTKEIIYKIYMIRGILHGKKCL